MTAWILGVLGTGVRGAVIVRLTDGTRAHKAVRTACIYAFVLALIFPVPMLINGEWSALSCDFGETEYDDGIADVTDEAYFALVAEAVDAELDTCGYDTDSEVTGTVYSDSAAVSRVDVTLYGEFADSSSEIVRIKEIVSEYLETDISIVYVYVKDRR